MKKITISKDYPCKCGHPALSHLNCYLGCTKNWASPTLLNCMCERFEADNLKYLEQLVDNNG